MSKTIDFYPIIARLRTKQIKLIRIVECQILNKEDTLIQAC